MKNELVHTISHDAGCVGSVLLVPRGCVPQLAKMDRKHKCIGQRMTRRPPEEQWHRCVQRSKTKSKNPSNGKKLQRKRKQQATNTENENKAERALKECECANKTVQSCLEKKHTVEEMSATLQAPNIPRMMPKTKI